MKVSVLIPAYNEENNLSEAVESLMKTNYRDFEIIIGVDGSTDKTLEIANDLKKKYKRIKVVYHPKRIGTVNNVNSILRKAKGEIILKFDADMRVGNPKDFFSRIDDHFKDERVGGIAIFGYKKADAKVREQIEIKKRNFISRGEYVVYELVDIFKKQILPLEKIPDFPIDIHCFRRFLVRKIDTGVIHDDAFFAYKVLEKGYKIEDGSDVVIIHLGTPRSFKGLSNTRVKGKVGWSNLSEKYPLNLKKYYFNLLSIFIKNLSLFGFYDIIAFFCWLAVFSASLVTSKFNKNKSITSVWKKRI